MVFNGKVYNKNSPNSKTAKINIWKGILSDNVPNFRYFLKL